MPRSNQLDPQLASLLQSLRRRVRRYIVWDSLLAILVVILAAFWIGLGLDFLPVQLGGTEMPRSARSVLLIIVGALLIGILTLLLVARLRRPLPDDSLALLIERQHPQLGGRLVTAVQLTRPGRTGDSHAAALLSRVHREAAAAVARVEPNRIFRWQPITRKAAIAGPLAVAAIGLAIFSPQTFARAASRLTLLSDTPWPRQAQLEMVGIELPVISAADQEVETSRLIEFQDHFVRLPRTSDPSLRIRAKAIDAVVPNVCTVYYETESGTRGQSNLRRVGRVTDGYQSFVLDGPPLAGLSESLTLSIRGLDDRLDDFHIEAVEPPVITEMQVAVRYPDYLRIAATGAVDYRTEYQAGLRLREGSDVTLVATSSRPLGDLDVFLRSDSAVEQPAAITYSDDRRQARLTVENFDSATTVRLVPRDRSGISAQAPYRYFFGVVLDEPPDLAVRLQGIGTAVTPVAKLPIQATATDDYAIEELRLVVSPITNETSETDETKQANETSGEAEEATESIEAVAIPTVDREGRAKLTMDLRDLVTSGQLSRPQPGDAVNLYGEATDAYDLGQGHRTRSDVHRLQIVTPEDLLALLERRELGLRSRLEQTIDEMQNLRDTLDLLARVGFLAEAADEEAERTRQQQVRRLRVQQSRLQADKTAQELSGIAAALNDLLAEMVNNRVDSVDRRERIGTGVRDPLLQTVEGPLARLREQIAEVETLVDQPEQAAVKTGQAVQTAEEVLLQLTAVLEKMLDLESYNEILDLVRGLIDDQQELIEQTKEEQKKRVLDLFE